MMLNPMTGLGPVASPPQTKAVASQPQKASPEVAGLPAESTAKPSAQALSEADSAAAAPAKGAVPGAAAAPSAFDALLQASRMKAGLTGTEVVAPPPASKTPLDALLSGIEALAAQQGAVDGVADLSGMVAAFAGLLQTYDAATGGQAVADLTRSLGLLDAEGMAQLAGLADRPAALLAQLATLANLPLMAESPAAGAPVALPVAAPVMMPQAGIPKGPLDNAPRKDEGPALTALHVGASGATASPSGSDGPLPASVAGGLKVGPATAKPEGAPSDLRAAVMGALAATSAGAEAEVSSFSAAGSSSLFSPMEARLLAAGANGLARPTDAWQPPASGFARNLTQQIRQASFVDGQTRISLAPRGLGEVEIEMAPDEAGNLRIVLRAENPAVLQALRGDRDGLLLTLSDSGADVRDADLSFEDFSHRQRGQADETGAPRRIPADVGPAAAPDPLPVPRGVIADGALDILT
jgi:hypothetical protein